MKKITTWLVISAIAFMGYACVASCGPGPGQSTAPVTYPSGYTLEKKSEKELSK